MTAEPRPMTIITSALAGVACVMMLAGPAAAGELTGMSPCSLIEGVPGAEHPIRSAPAFRKAFGLLSAAGAHKLRNARAQGRFRAQLDALYSRARRIFHPKDPSRISRRKAQHFLERYVLGPNPVLKVGLERFEPQPALAAAVMLAACRAGDREASVRLGRASTGPDAASLRAFAALLLLEAGRLDEARELLAGLGDEGFLGPWIRAELAPDPREARRQHALASRRVVTPDQETALAMQAKRLEAK